MNNPNFKVCSYCWELRSILEFRIGRDQCDICVKARRKSYNDSHKERSNARSKSYDESHKEEIKSRKIIYYELNKESRKAYAKVQSDNLTDTYVRNLIGYNMKIPTNLIPSELIELKRTILLIKREIKARRTV